MCGIVGCLGGVKATSHVLDGLKRLEYRGYDSAGVAFVSHADANFKTFKKQGKLDNLQTALAGEDISSDVAIGHTRWATHGRVNDLNAHPHTKNNLSVVHNGIIENARELREQLEKDGIELHSETDSEVFLGLVWKYHREGQTLRNSVTKAFSHIRGNSAFVALNATTKEIVAVKRAAPLVCGTSNSTGLLLVSSDPYALIGKSDLLFFPEDNVVCELKMGNTSINFYELDGKKSERFFSQEQKTQNDVNDKMGFEHYMLKEIHEQPGLIRSLLTFYAEDKQKEILHQVASFRPKFIHITACGTAWHAGLLLRDAIEALLQIPCRVELASEFRYRDPLLNKEDLGIFISQSGETADTLAAQELCKKAGVKTLAIVNVEGSTLYRNCDFNLLLGAGPEIGVASTKAFTQMVLVGHLYCHALKKSSWKESIQKKFNLLAQRLEDIIHHHDEIKNIAEEIHRQKGFIFTGRNIDFPIALEGALKLKEIAYVHAEGYAAGELKHGPIALIDEEMVNIAIVTPELYEKTVSNLHEVKSRRGIIVGIGPKGDKALEEVCDYYIPVEMNGLELLNPLNINVTLQLLAYYMAKFKGTDIDRPRNLAKSVTVE